MNEWIEYGRPHPGNAGHLSELSALRLVAATAKWVASQQTTQFAVAATDHSALSSDEKWSVEMRSDEMRWDALLSIIQRGQLHEHYVPCWVLLEGRWPPCDLDLEKCLPRLSRPANVIHANNVTQQLNQKYVMWNVVSAPLPSPQLKVTIVVRKNANIIISRSASK